MFKCIKDWFKGNSPDYKGMADKMAEQIYHDECSVIGEDSEVMSGAKDSPKRERKGIFSMAEDLVETKLPGEDGAYVNVPVSSNSFEHVNAMPGLFPLSPNQIDRSSRTTQIKQDSEYKFVKVMWFQNCHDKYYHTDIYNLPMMRRLNHLNSHLVKYMSKYNKYLLTGAQQKELIVDGIICCISALCALHYNPQRATVADFFVGQRILSIEEIDVEIGRIAKVLEGWDHLEDINYREELKKSFAMIAASLLNIYYLNGGMAFVYLVYQPRLNLIKHKHVFHEFFLEQGKALMDVQSN